MPTRHGNGPAWMAACLFALALAGCGDGGECLGTPRAGLVVRVVDATGTTVCDVTVTATDGSYMEELYPPEGPCSDSALYTGAIDRPGQYTVRALGSSGQVLASAEAEVLPLDDCNVQSTWLTLELE